MTKKEQAAMQAAIDRAETLAALRWTAPVERDVLPPESGSYSEGWDYNAYNKTVERYWSSAVSHGCGEAPTNGVYRSGSQNCRRLYSTERLALMAMRHEIEKGAAKALLAIDRKLRDLPPNARYRTNGK